MHFGYSDKERCNIIDLAAKSDSDELMPLLLSAIGAIAHTLSGTSDDSETWDVLRGYIGQERNRISYRNIIVDRKTAALRACSSVIPQIKR